MVAALLLLCATLLAGALFTTVDVRAVESAAPPFSRYVEVDGPRLHYTDQGEGAPLMLVHVANSSLLELQASLVPLLAGHGHALHHVDPERVASLIHQLAARALPG